jgi:hypothetical protein
VAAGALGVTLTRYLGLLAYSPKGAAQAAATPAGPKVPVAPPEEWNNLFAPGDGMKMASRLPAAGAKSASKATRSSFVLVGTIVSSTPSASRAVLWANGMKEPKAFRETEEVEPGAFLASVERDKAWITRGKEREKLEILPVGSRARPTAAGAPAVAPPIASAVSRTDSSHDMSPRPEAADAPRSLPQRTEALVVGPKAPPPVAADEEGFSSQGQRRRSRGVSR